MREPVRLTQALLAAHRSGAAVAVAEGHPAGIPARRPSGYEIRSSARVAEASSRGALAPPPSSVAIVPVRGVLEQRAAEWSCGQTCGYDEIEERLTAALFDPGVDAVILDVDSPGGDVPGLEEGVARMRAAVLTSGKPCLGLANEAAFSAALWLLLGICDASYLPRSGRMGAVGSVCIFSTEARKLESEGTDVYVARDPAGKMKPNPVEPLDEVGKERLDRHAAECSGRFIAAISALRSIDPEVIRGWNGDTFTGDQAVEAGLADGVMSLDELVAVAAANADMRAAA
jgi:capsid assembly protease